MTGLPGAPGDASPPTFASAAGHTLPSTPPSEHRERYVASWSFDPWRERPVVAGVAALAVLGMWLILAACRFPWLLAVGLGGLVASPLVPGFMPADCRIEPTGVARRGALGWMRRSWSDVRRIDDVPVGLLLSPYAARHWLDATRALTLPMPRPRRAELASLVREQWRAHAR